MKKLKTIIVAITVLLIIYGISCKKDDDNNNQTPTNEQVVKAIQDYALASKIFSDAFAQSDDAARKSDDRIDNNTQGQKDSYPIITITPFDAVTWPKNITVDFGETNYLCQDGRLRRGKIMLNTTGFYRQEGTVITITFDNYYQNNHKVEGTQIITNLGRNTENHLHYSVEINEGKITTPDNKVINFEENTTRTWIEGEETFFAPCDDVYNISGTQNGTSSNGINYTLSTATPLNVQACCKWIRGGILNVDIEGLETISINYGDNSCDQNAVVIINNIEYPIIME